MWTLVIILTSIISAIYLRIIFMDSREREEANGESNILDKTWNNVMDGFGLPFAKSFMSILYAIYTRITLTSFFNVLIFALKYVLTLFYMYKFIKDVYLTSRERIRLKQIEIEDIQLQIQIVTTKMCVRDAEFSERAEQLRRGADRLRKVRTRVRDVIAADDALRQALDDAAQWDVDHDIHLDAAPPEEDRGFMVELLKDLKYDYFLKPERTPEKMECGEHAQTDPNTPENSVYSSLSDVDIRQDCRVKIVKVTNVYKIAYLKHYIKQKRLRRATKQALLKKKMENIKKLLEDWQRSLNMVINSKLTILNIDPHPMDVASQEAMGDYSKPHDSSESDSDMRNSWPDMSYDEHNLNWAQNPYKPYAYNYEDVPDPSASREFYDSQDYGDGYFQTPPVCCDCGKGANMTSIIEETISQMAIEETKSEAPDDYECRDLVVL